jgi:hypothetical protein
MTSQRRILLCRLGFVFFCVVPTLAVGIWVAAVAERQAAAPIDVAKLRQELSSRLGMVIEIERASGSCEAFRLEGLRIRDPETSEILAQAAAVEATRTSTGWQIEAFSPAVDLTHMRRLASRLHDRLLCGPKQELPSLTMAARDVLLSGNGQQLSINQIVAGLTGQDTGPQLTVELQWNSVPAVPIRLSFARDQQATPPATNWQIATNGEQLPIAMLTALLPEIARLGPQCHFAGTISGVEGLGGSGWSGELSGTLDQVDFDSLVTEHFPHRLSGIGTIHIERASIQDGRLAMFRGGIDIASGSTSKSLLDAAREHLGVIASEEVPTSEFATIPFQRLAMDLQLDGRRLQLRGVAGALDDSIVLAGASGPLLRADPGHSVPAVNLLRALLPDNQFQVPATRQTDVLVGLLPLPDLAPTRTAALPTHVPTRLRSSGPAEAAPVLRQPGLR